MINLCFRKDIFMRLCYRCILTLTTTLSFPRELLAFTGNEWIPGWPVWAGLILLSLLIGYLIILLRKRTTEKKEWKELSKAQEREIQNLRQLLKLKVLQTRVNPHFLFNSLNAIQYYITTDDKRTSLQYISRFSVFLRNVIRLGDELYIPLKEEAELIREYLWLEQIRFPGQFDYEVNLPDDEHYANILPLLTHGLVEAALYKGILNDTKKGKISIDFARRLDTLYVEVTNNGINWAEAEEIEKRKGVAVVEEDILQRRIRLFNRQAKRKISLEYSSGNNDGGETLNCAKLQVPQPLFDIAI